VSAPLRIRFAEAPDVPTLLMLIRELAADESSAVTTTEADLLRDGFGERRGFHAQLALLGEEPAGFSFYAFT
jgi:hypothetical protein